MRISDWSSDVCSSDLKHDRFRLYRRRTRGDRRLLRFLGVAADGQVGLVAAARPRLARALRLAADAGRRRPCGARLCRLWRGLYRRGAAVAVGGRGREARRSEEHTSELQSLMRISYAVFCLKKKNTKTREQEMHSDKE